MEVGSTAHHAWLVDCRLMLRVADMEQQVRVLRASSQTHPPASECNHAITSCSSHLRAFSGVGRLV